MDIKTKLPNTANRKAKLNLKVIDSVPNARYAIKIPNCAESVTPTTEGEINLFLLIVCRIKPLMDNPTAVNTIEIVLGTLEVQIKNHVA
jgi:hypothetical protein